MIQLRFCLRLSQVSSISSRPWTRCSLESANHGGAPTGTVRMERPLHGATVHPERALLFFDKEHTHHLYEIVTRPRQSNACSDLRRAQRVVHEGPFHLPS
jgi:hypothetical protein